MKALITGAAGFIGSHLTEHLLLNTDWELVLIDKLTYAANGMSRLRDIKVFERANRDRVRMYPVDLVLGISEGLAQEIGAVDYVLHLAAETHVDNSVHNPEPFVFSNVVGTFRLLEYLRKLNSRLRKFIYFSTDEVFGPCPPGIPGFTEWARYNSTNPYSSTKAAGEELCLGWANTYDIPTIITHCMNAFGERQHPEKFIPSTVKKILRREPVLIHCDSLRKHAGSRFYIHCRNIASAVLFLLERNDAGRDVYGKYRDKFNIMGEKEVDNLTLAKQIHAIMEVVMEQKLPLVVDMVDFHSSRPYHDLRYSLDGKRMADLGWAPPKTFDESLEKTIRWMLRSENIQWLMIS